MKNKFKILSLDGGGIRGYLTILILENIEKQFNYQKEEFKPLYQYFDFIVGTSTGSIIAGLLAIGKSAKEIREIYENSLTTIFSKEMKRTIPYIKAKYSKDNLIKEAEKHFADMKFKDVKIPLLITSTDIKSMKARLHKSPYHKNFLDRENEKLSSAIISSCSAPSYFPVEENLKYSSMLVDGGIVANNPSLIALIDAKMFHNTENKEISLLSIGTGKLENAPYNVNKLKDTGIKWIPSIFELIINSQSNLVEDQTKFFMKVLNQERSYLRINPKLTDKIELDDTSKIALLEKYSSLNFEEKEWLEENLN